MNMCKTIEKQIRKLTNSFDGSIRDQPNFMYRNLNVWFCKCILDQWYPTIETIKRNLIKIPQLELGTCWGILTYLEISMLYKFPHHRSFHAHHLIPLIFHIKIWSKPTMNLKNQTQNYPCCLNPIIPSKHIDQQNSPAKIQTKRTIEESII